MTDKTQNDTQAFAARFRDSAKRHADAVGAPRRPSATPLRDRIWNKLAAIWKSLRPARSEPEILRDSGLFDSAWYLYRYPDVEEAGADPVGHYVRHGAAEGRDPHPLFDSTWYYSRYPDVRGYGQTPLSHFLSVGAAKHYDPHPLFNVGWYLAQNPDVAAAGMNPLLHYAKNGAEPGRNPNPFFDSAWYLREYKDVQEAGVNPLAHYIHYGIAEMRDPHPLFDTEWYLKNYEHVGEAGIDALEHYLTIGMFEGCRPGPEESGQARQRRVGGKSAVVEPPGGERLPAKESNGASDPANILAWQMELGGRPHDHPPFTGQIGVFIHLFYEDLAEEIAASLQGFPFGFKVYVSTNSAPKKQTIQTEFRRFGIEPVVKIVQNRGWDVAPFVVAFREEIRSHEICLKLHGKASKHAHRGYQWRKYLLTGLVGTPQNVKNIVGEFLDYPELGVLMLPHWSAVAHQIHKIGVNYRHMRGLLQRAGIKISSGQKVEFPSGSMFWFRSKALAPLLDLGLTWKDFADCRPRNVDATIAHAVERSVLILAASAGYKWAYHSARGWWKRWRLPRRAPKKVSGEAAVPQVRR